MSRHLPRSSECTVVPGYGRTSQVKNHHLACNPESKKKCKCFSEMRVLLSTIHLSCARPDTNPEYALFDFSLGLYSRTWVRPYKPSES